MDQLCIVVMTSNGFTAGKETFSFAYTVVRHPGETGKTLDNSWGRLVIILRVSQAVLWLTYI